MTSRTRAVAGIGVLLVAAAAAVAASHYRGSHAAPVATVEESGAATSAGTAMLVLMTDDRCVYQGAAPPKTGFFAVRVENQTVRDGHFVLGKMAAGTTQADVSAYLTGMRRQLKHGGRGPLHLPPEWLEPVSDTAVVSGAISALPANNGPGRYLVLCIQENKGGIHAFGAAAIPPS